MLLFQHHREMKKYVTPIALFSILVATKIQAAGEGSVSLLPAGKSLLMTAVYAVIVSLFLAGGVYGLVYWVKKRKGQR